MIVFGMGKMYFGTFPVESTVEKVWKKVEKV